MKRIPTFTVLLLMVVLSLSGLATVPLLNIQYSPESAGRVLTVSYTWPNANERIIEAEVTSVLEGVLSGLGDCTSVTSVSERGRGDITLRFRKGTDMDAVRLEVSSRIRTAWESLPEGVSYPAILSGGRGARSRTALTYVFKSPRPSMEIEKFVTGYVMMPVSSVPGVDKVSFWGATPYELEVVYDYNAAELYGITAQNIASAFDLWYTSEILGLALVDDNTVNVKLACLRSGDIGEIPICNSSGRIICLRDIATWKYKESEPASYFRMNGLNTVMLSVDTAPEVNFLQTVEAVKRKMSEMQEYFPDDITASVTYDATEYISSELDKIYLRTGLCILILLAFVYLVSRSLKYLAAIFATLAVNIATAVLFYNIFHLPVHIYTLAGITVSLGIIIDTSIMMADHYSYYRNRSVFPALLGATATTIGALCVILLLPEKDKANLEDFSKVIMINLAVSLLTAWFFVPSLIERFPIRRPDIVLTMKKRRRTVRWNRFYCSYLERGLKFRWIYLSVLILVFGGTGYMFSKVIDRSDYYREPGRDLLYINAGMPEGCTVGQLNEVVKSMENYLSLFDEIETFITSIYDYDNAMIEVAFRPDVENTAFPSELKSMVTTMAMNFGGATWRIWGINDSYFNNNVVSDYKSNTIKLSGYSYDDLAGYADSLISYLESSRRVSAPEMMLGSFRLAGTEFNMEYDFEQLETIGISPYLYYNRLYSVLYDNELLTISGPSGDNVDVVLRSSSKDSFDLWHVLNSYTGTDNMKVRLSEIGSIEKQRTSLPIRRHNQSYEILVGYDFIGSYELAKAYMDDTLEHFNEDLLPIGYKAESTSVRSWDEESKLRYALSVLLVIAVIYVMTSMTFDSARFPLSVLLLIPISFVGVFLVFGLSEFTFDQGGFAALVMLSGIVVNAGIYLVNSFVSDKSHRSDIRKYVKAFNHKIKPILLTVISTVLGLVPFLFDGPDEVFWFPFAVGTIGGMIFSLIALLLYFPVFCVRKRAMPILPHHRE